jgi:hypothetical protein
VAEKDPTGDNIIKLLTAGICKRASLVRAGNTKEGSITVPLTSCLTGLEFGLVCFANKNKNCQLSYS